MFELKPDFETTLRRMEAFWARELIDRPLVTFSLSKPVEQRVSYPASGHATAADRWLDAEYQANYMLAALSNQLFLGDTLPVASVNLGPDVLASLYGCELLFGDYGTSWSRPKLTSWDEADQIAIDLEGFYMRKLVELTDAFLKVGRGKFITGMADWHTGGDLLAAFRGVETLAVDLLESREAVKALLRRLEADYFRVYDLFYDKLRDAGLPLTTWLPLASNSRYYIPSNDFSILISNRMFEEVFLTGITRECQFLDHSIYHLDGPGALRHLDSILGIEKLDALQFVPGDGNEGYARWIPVYQKAQRARKAIEVFCRSDELSLVMDTLRPEGVWLAIDGVSDRETGEAILAAVEKWTVSSSRSKLIVGMQHG